eukprot:904161-Rhodomonas_salina.2
MEEVRAKMEADLGPLARVTRLHCAVARPRPPTRNATPVQNISTTAQYKPTALLCQQSLSASQSET